MGFQARQAPSRWVYSFNLGLSLRSSPFRFSICRWSHDGDHSRRAGWDCQHARSPCAKEQLSSHSPRLTAYLAWCCCCCRREEYRAGSWFGGRALGVPVDGCGGVHLADGRGRFLRKRTAARVASHTKDPALGEEGGPRSVQCKGCGRRRNDLENHTGTDLSFLPQASRHMSSSNPRRSSCLHVRRILSLQPLSIRLSPIRMCGSRSWFAALIVLGNPANLFRWLRSTIWRL